MNRHLFLPFPWMHDSITRSKVKYAEVCEVKETPFIFLRKKWAREIKLPVWIFLRFFLGSSTSYAPAWQPGWNTRIHGHAWIDLSYFNWRKLGQFCTINVNYTIGINLPQTHYLISHAHMFLCNRTTSDRELESLTAFFYLSLARARSHSYFDRV